MKNEFKILGDETILYYKSRKNENFEIIIDTDFLEKLEKINYKVCCHWFKQSGLYYASITMYKGIIDGKPKYKSVMLHKIILNCPEGSVIDHINNNSLDNRISNLRISSNVDNIRNRKSKNSNNKSGCRNVSFYDGWYLVQLQIDGKNKLLLKTKDYELACSKAEEFRKLYYKEFSGKS